MEETVTKIAELRDNFGFRTERIHLLFHDKEVWEGIEIAENSEFSKLVQNLNNRYFKGNPVIKIRNKPNFVKKGADEVRKLFLKELLNDSLFFKTYTDDSKTFVNILGLLEHMKIITEHPSSNYVELKLGPSDWRFKNEYLERKKQEISKIYDDTKSQDNCHLLPFFNQAIRESSLYSDLPDWNPALKKFCVVSVELYINQIKTQMIEVEACHSFIKAVPEVTMKENIQNLVKYFYKSGSLGKVKALEGKLEAVKRHFPERESRVDSLLNTVTSNARWYKGKNFLFGAATVAGLCVFPITGVVAGIAAGVYAGVELVSVAGAFAGFIGGTMGFAIIIAPFATLQTTVALELVFEDSTFCQWRLNENQLKAIYPEQPDTPTTIILLLGSEAMHFSEFANAYARYIAPFEPVEFEAFSPNKHSQILSFNYYNPDQSGTLTRCYFICLRMDEYSSSHYQVMMKIAEIFIPVASVACFLVDDPNHYAQPLLDILFPPVLSDESQPQTTQIKTKFVVLHRKGTNKDGMERTLYQYRANTEMQLMSQMRNEDIAVMINLIKRGMDQSEVQSFSVFREKINQLSGELRQFSQ